MIYEDNGGVVRAKCGNGCDYPIGKAFVDGYEIDRKEYEKLGKALYGDNFIQK